MEQFSDIFPVAFREELLALNGYLTSQRRQTLPELLRAWSRYSELLASRVPITSDDYMAMLFARDAIQDLLQRATPLAFRVLEALIGHSDSLFLYGTRVDEDHVLIAADEDDRVGWWWNRVPEVFGN